VAPQKVCAAQKGRGGLLHGIPAGRNLWEITLGTREYRGSFLMDSLLYLILEFRYNPSPPSGYVSARAESEFFIEIE
jgi:hypothetical protein